MVCAIVLQPIAASGSAASKEPKAPRAAPTNLAIVVLADGADPLAAARALGVEPVYVYSSVFSGFAAALPAAAASGARRSGVVFDVSPDATVRADAQTVPTGVSRIDAAPARTRDARTGGPRPRRGDTDVDVAVLDSGISKHRDLNVKDGKACIGKNALRDRDGHGTHVAGIIGAKDNGIDVVGVAPGARVWAVKVLDAAGVGATSAVICGLDWVHKHRSTIDVVNMSLSGDGEDGACLEDPFHRAICRVVAAGVPVVVSAGNQQKLASSMVPAAWPETIAVSAFGDSDGAPGGLGPTTCNGDADDTFAFFSNFGPAVDIAAPGECILSTYKRKSVRQLSGASQAAPHVTGAIARYKADRRRADAAAVRSWLVTEASRPQDSPQGFTGDVDLDHERVLYLGP